MGEQPVPDLLRTIATAEEDAAWDALGTLVWEIFHQGTMYAVTAPTVHYLAELLAIRSGQLRTSILHLLGKLTHGYTQDSVDPIRIEVRAAASAQVDRVLPLLSDPDPLTRYLAAYTLAGCPDRAADILPALLERWAVEADPRVRGSLVLAVGAFEPEKGLLAEALAEGQPPAVRAGAVLAVVTYRLPWPGRPAIDAVRIGWRHGDPLVGDDGHRWYPEALENLLDYLAPADQIPALEALLSSIDHVVREQAVTRTSVSIKRYRSMRRPAVQMLAPHLADPDPGVRLAAAYAIRSAGQSGAEAADELAKAASRPEDDAARQAHAALLRLGDPRGRLNLPERIRCGDVIDDLGDVLVAVQARPTPDLVDAVRHRLGALAADTANAAPPESLIDICEMPHRRSRDAELERAALLRLLASWGPTAAPTVGELVGLLHAGRSTNEVIDTLGAIGPGAEAALSALHEQARACRPGFLYDRKRLALARTVWLITDDPGPAVEQAWRQVTDGTVAEAVELLAQIGRPAQRLLPQIRSTLNGWLGTSQGFHSGRIELARLAWQWTGEPGIALPTVAEFLNFREPDDHWHSMAEAAILGTEIGHAPAREALTELLDGEQIVSHSQRLRAYRALLRSTGYPDALLLALVEGVKPSEFSPTAWQGILDLLADLGQAATATLPVLRWLATGDESTVSRYYGADEDERVKAAMLATIEKIEAEGTA